MQTLYGAIKDLQHSGDKYTIVECGTGACIADLFLSIPGASNMIEECRQPYSKDSQEKFLGEKFGRSVSTDWVIKAMAKVKGPCVITQFQVQSGDVKTLTHGYIGIRGKYGEKIYHMSIYKNFSDDYMAEESGRSQYFNIIKDTVLTLMIRYSLNHTQSLANLLIDGAFFEDGFLDLEETLNIMGQSDREDTMIVMNEGNWNRLEDWARDTDGLIIMRGSFNPLHKSHIEMMAAARKLYPTYQPAFLISLNNRDKPPVSYEDAIERAYPIQDFGYNVIFSSLPYFDNSTRLIHDRWPDKKVIYPVGLDTVNRFIEDAASWDKKAHDGIGTVTSPLTQKKHNESETWKEWSEESLKDGGIWGIVNKEAWENHKLLVFDRTGYTLHPYAKYFENVIQMERTYKDINAISSTKIREGEQSTGLDFNEN